MSKKSGFLLGAIVGGTAAAVAALILAPESGKDLRNRLARQVDDLLDTASDYTDDTVEKGQDMKQTIKDKTTIYTKRLEELAEMLKEKVSDVVDEVTNHSDDILSEIEEEVAEISEEMSV